MFHNYRTETPFKPTCERVTAVFRELRDNPCILVRGTDGEVEPSVRGSFLWECCARITPRDWREKAEPVTLKHCWSCHSITSVQKEEEDRVTICVWYRILPTFAKSAHYAEVRAARPWNTSGLFTLIMSFIVTKSRSLKGEIRVSECVKIKFDPPQLSAFLNESAVVHLRHF